MPRIFDDSEDRWSKREGNPVIHALAVRSWYVVVPLIAVWWFHAKEVKPQLSAVEVQINADRQAAELTRNNILAEVRKLGVETSRLRAEADTFEVRTGQYQALIDSVRILQQGHLQETRRLEAEADSLRRVLSESEGDALRYSNALTGLQARVDSLQTLIEEHRQETSRLEEEIAVDRDLTDRLLRPDVYRKNTALVTGQGDYPNRDALPKR